jgi:hypothetical protein
LAVYSVMILNRLVGGFIVICVCTGSRGASSGGQSGAGRGGSGHNAGGGGQAETRGAVHSVRHKSAGRNFFLF